mmetsp:Transcript_16374/g.33292  ORF Transcript_16374/g.33292 Transcript_16374/m.33292 type:complete len:115 (-) Transcript_16374:466-810(-)
MQRFNWRLFSFALCSCRVSFFGSSFQWESASFRFDKGYTEGLLVGSIGNVKTQERQCENTARAMGRLEKERHRYAVGGLVTTVDQKRGKLMRGSLVGLAAGEGVRSFLLIGISR